MSIEIEKVDGGYITTNSSFRKVFVTFDEVVNWLARHFSESEIGKDWEPHHEEKG